MTAQRPLEIFLYGAGPNLTAGINTQSAALEYLLRLGLRINPHYKVCSTLDEVFAFISHWQDQRGGSLPYEIDGVVVKVNDLAVQKELGSTARSPPAGRLLISSRPNKW